MQLNKGIIGVLKEVDVGLCIEDMAATLRTRWKEQGFLRFKPEGSGGLGFRVFGLGLYGVGRRVFRLGAEGLGNGVRSALEVPSLLTTAHFARMLHSEPIAGYIQEYLRVIEGDTRSLVPLNSIYHNLWPSSQTPSSGCLLPVLRP